MTDPVIAVRDLSFRYPGAARDSLRNVNLTIERGDFVAVVGGNGSGKTTLCKTFNGLVPHYWSGEFAGTVLVDGADTWESSVARLSWSVGYVYQDFQNQLVRPTVWDEVAFGPINFGFDDHAERTRDALAAAGIAHLAEKFVWQLSGGQAHRVALASVLALRPAVIVVDEPVAELDPASAHDVYERLTMLNREHGVTVIAIEHHAEFIAQYARSVVLMSDGAPVWHLPAEEALARAGELADHGIPAPQVVDALQRAGIREVARGVSDAATLLREGGIVFVPTASHGAERTPSGPAGPTRADRTPTVAQGDAEPAAAGSAGSNRLSTTSRAVGHRLDDAAEPGAEHASAGPTTVAPARIGTPARTGASPRTRSESAPPVVAEARRVSHGYRSVAGEVEPVIRDLDLALRAGDRVALIGGNGSGKTTLMRLLAGIHVPRSGDIMLEGETTRAKRAGRLAERAAYLSQHPERMLLKASVREDVELFPRSRRDPSTDEIVDRILERVRLTELADRDGRTLSGGQQRRATLAIGLAMRPALLLLDEPTASLDVASRDDVIAMLTELSDRISCAVIATHDMHLVAEWATRVIALDGGRIAADCSPRELFADDALLTRARLVPPQVTLLGRELGMDPLPLTVDEFERAVSPMVAA